ncbi:hypothetical protein [Paracoccus alkanivorans]|uniref:Uncharacterized protein n=1 Tax=Paracoccus alkanivorans TaxID=2116655 RepID=A0A3M0MUE8_9RHOB|nr:hypothetical protein [Paracoccus alkanivorans]RMC34937.1 hypothetical protein C9E81_12675 [Paracoccus alkanivorans]
MRNDQPVACQFRPRVAAAMMAWLRRRMVMRAGGRLANPLIRLSRAVSCARKAQRFRLCNPERRSLTIRMTLGPTPFSALGLGLAGGGGGSPGSAATV